MIEYQTTTTPRQGMIQIDGPDLAEAGGSVSNGPARRHDDAWPFVVGGGKRHLHLVLDHGDLDGTRYAVDHEARPQRTRCTVCCRHDEGAVLGAGHRRGGEVGDTGQQLDSTLGVRIVHRDGAGGAKVHSAAIGKGDVLLGAGRGAMVGHQQDLRIAEPEKRSADQEQQAGRQWTRLEPGAAPFPLSDAGRPRRARRPTRRRGALRKCARREAKLAHLVPRRPGFVEGCAVQGTSAEPFVEIPPLRLAQGTATEAGSPGCRGRVDFVLSVACVVHVLDQVPSDINCFEPSHEVGRTSRPDSVTVHEDRSKLPSVREGAASRALSPWPGASGPSCRRFEGAPPPRRR